MKNLLNSLVMVVLLLVGYHFALDYFAGTKFKIFNYHVEITKCGPKTIDRIDKIEQHRKKQ